MITSPNPMLAIATIFVAALHAKLGNKCQALDRRFVMRILFWMPIVAAFVLCVANFTANSQNSEIIGGPVPVRPYPATPSLPPFLTPIYSEVIPTASGLSYEPAYDNLESFVAPNGKTVRILVKGPKGTGTYTRSMKPDETPDTYFPSIVSEAVQAGAHKVIIPKGTYEFQPPNAINPATGQTWARCFENNSNPFSCPAHWVIGTYPNGPFTTPTPITGALVDLDIELSGSTLNFNSPTVGIWVLNALRVRLSNYTIDWPNLPIASLGTIVADPANPCSDGSLCHKALTIDPQYPVTSPYYPGGNIQIQAVDPWEHTGTDPSPGVYSSNLGTEEYFTFGSAPQPTYVGRTSEGAHTYSCKSCSFQDIPADGACSFFTGCANFDPFSIGERVLVRHYTMFNGAAILLTFTEDIDLENFSILTGPTDGVDTDGNNGLRGLRINNAKITRAPGRLVTVPSGALGISQDDFQLENSFIGYGGDDLLNVSPLRSAVDTAAFEANGQTLVTYQGQCHLAVHNDPVIGDTVAFYDPNFVYLDSARVISEDNDCDGSGNISLSLKMHNSNLIDAFKSLPSGENVTLVDLTNSDGARYIIKGNRFEYNRQHGILGDTSYGLIDGNSFMHNTSGAIMIADVLQGDGGPGAANIIISNNKISNSPASPDNGALAAISIWGLNQNSEIIKSPLFQKIIVSGNDISNVTSAAIAFTSTQYLALEENTVADSNQSSQNNWGNLFNPLSGSDSILIFDSYVGEVCATTTIGPTTGPIGVSPQVDLNVTVQPICPRYPIPPVAL
jgi:hypothetical protein